MMIKQDVTALAKIAQMHINQGAKSTPSLSPSGDSFQSILNGLLAKAQESTSASPAMSQQQLMLLVKAVQIQMNSRLFQSVFSQSLESNPLALQVLQNYGGKSPDHLSDASNKSQATPKKDPDAAEPSGDINQIIQDAAQKYNVDSKLIRSVIKAESNFNIRATSPKGAAGLMQLMPETARELGVTNIYDPRENVMGGTRYLKMLLDRYQGQTDLALAAYNWGMGNLEKKPDQLPQETSNYIAKVKSYYQNASA